MTLSNPALEMWPLVSAADAEALVRLAVPYVRWLHPALVAALADDNTKESSSWHAILGLTSTCGPVVPACFLASGARWAN
jgi:hypothetical protein